MHRQFMTATQQPEKVTDKVSLPTLSAMVVGSMMGPGSFCCRGASAPRQASLGRSSPGPSPDGNVDAGLRLSAAGHTQTRSRCGHLRVRQGRIRRLRRFNSAIGYWASACAGNTSYRVLITATMSALVPGFGAGDTVLAVVVSAICVWLFAFLVMRGVKDATGIIRRRRSGTRRQARC
jgi:arginine:ornithine antiporter / lysine permease